MSEKIALTEVEQHEVGVVDMGTGEILPATNVEYSTNGELATLQQAMEYLERAASPSEAKRVVNMAEAMRYAAQQANMGLEAQNEAAELKIRAQRKVGEMLANMELEGGRPKTVTAGNRFSLGAEPRTRGDSDVEATENQGDGEEGQA